jgi:hypothetical protein
MKIKKFEVGKTYFCRSSCNHECIWKFKVLSRTEKTVQIEEQGFAKEAKQNIYGNFRICFSKYDEAEMVYPLGRYSMAPILSAENITK